MLFWCGHAKRGRNNYPWMPQSLDHVSMRVGVGGGNACRIVLRNLFSCSLTLHRKFGRRTPTDPCLLFSAGVM